MKKLLVFFLFAFIIFSCNKQDNSSQRSITGRLNNSQYAAAPGDDSNIQKFALVIGNSNYTGISKLNNPVNDANDMEKALNELGFTVEKVLNGSLEQMENAILNLERRLGAARNSYGFFFYAGHGVQANGENYLIPVAANNIRSEAQLRDRAVSLQFVLDTLSDAGNELNMIVLDACRDNPFGWARSGSRGLTVVNRAPAGSIVMYATSANSTADDGAGRNGLFTNHLLNNLTTPELSVFDVFDRTMANVINATNGMQHPELSLRFAGATSAFLGSRPAPVLTTAATSAPAQSENIAVVPVLADIPENMVLINGGNFLMGSRMSEWGRQSNEGIQRQVTISSFYINKYLVTQKEYQEIMGENPSVFKGDNLPVERVSWFQAIEYCNKKSLKEGLTPVYTINGSQVSWDRNANGYRLPTEAEWEYACRAGTTTPYNLGSFINDIAWYADNSGRKTNPVGLKQANAWGLFDMHGNVAEWCWDWFADYTTVVIDPSGPASGQNRVHRGRSWNDTAESLRSANRGYAHPQNTSSFTGFRIVRNVL
ncbi:MAG: SUMF1/EgtB/PvdO family nonheme iron enzyme [Treponema sp.]|nr:SUMF1/EgtB/PvdO family nonheme iron enzyme [Treponema sp.]